MANDASNLAAEGDDFTRILKAVQRGDPKAADELLPLIYNELHRLALARAVIRRGQTAIQCRHLCFRPKCHATVALAASHIAQHNLRAAVTCACGCQTEVETFGGASMTSVCGRARPVSPEHEHS